MQIFLYGSVEVFLIKESSGCMIFFADRSGKVMDLSTYFGSGQVKRYVTTFNCGQRPVQNLLHCAIFII